MLKPEIIAECGTAYKSRHEALDLVADANNAHADTVKFQLFVPDEPLFCRMPGDSQRWERWIEATLPFEDWAAIKDLTEKFGMSFLVSVFQHGGLKMAKELGCTRIKVASRAAKTFPYDDWDGEFLVSASMNGAITHWKYPVQCLECIPKYPTPMNEARWPAGYNGLSDHSGNPWVAIDALARGCPIVEVHVDGMPGSITFDQLKLICEARDAFAAMQA